jgi:hypothetical protein
MSCSLSSFPQKPLHRGFQAKHPKPLDHPTCSCYGWRSATDQHILIYKIAFMRDKHHIQVLLLINDPLSLIVKYPRVTFAVKLSIRQNHNPETPSQKLYTLDKQ